ncbi:hypothetical protein [Vibrio methylphosphonaticus]|uniref:hypothetical protein n=1 Tax=Vibrio methylphosphonaticus TaxID=2946866 RepID=UPI002029D0B4|nr:hypothetical protein [Vibrio methylphosphonaticus]MCL9775914.1 hypothetical protein [Vibrio methylphosphonaticus]
MTDYVTIDIPFESRHQCWFCGEPSNGTLRCPQSISHVSLHGIELPVCTECASFVDKRSQMTIWPLRLHIKDRLLNKYAKHLGIGVIWTKEELEQSQLEGAIFEGFRTSAWTMYEIARQRIDFQGWALTVDGNAVESLDDTFFFEFQGTRFLTVESAVAYYVKSEGLDDALLSGLLDIVGKDQFEYGLRITRLNPRPTKKLRKQLLREVEQQRRETDKVATLSNSRVNDVDISAIRPIVLNNTVIEVEAITWMMARAISTLNELSRFEDCFFEEHEHLGGPRAFQLFDGIQLYLQAREDQTWAEKLDPNQLLWSQLYR